MSGIERSNEAKFDCLLFDVDDTLYPMSSGINLACRKNIQDYMLNYLHIEESQVPKMCLDLYQEYGTTMAGLKAIGYEFDDDEFHHIVHGRLPYEKLKPDPVLRNLLHSMPQRKIIFSNADKGHVARVLTRLGLEDCFEGVISFETLNPPPNQTEIETGDQKQNPKPRVLCKPLIESFEAAIIIANIDPNRTIFFDDSVRNIASAKAAGLHTVHVGNSSSLVPGADYALSSIHNIKEALPHLWEPVEQTAAKDNRLEQLLETPAVQTTVEA